MIHWTLSWRIVLVDTGINQNLSLKKEFILNKEKQPEATFDRDRSSNLELLRMIQLPLFTKKNLLFILQDLTSSRFIIYQLIKCFDLLVIETDEVTDEVIRVGGLEDWVLRTVEPWDHKFLPSCLEWGVCKPAWTYPCMGRRELLLRSMSHCGRSACLALRFFVTEEGPAAMIVVLTADESWTWTLATEGMVLFLLDCRFSQT
jgi:hypothetical protein